MPYRHFINEHVGYHERILVEHLMKLNETPHKELLNLAQKNPEKD